MNASNWWPFIKLVLFIFAALAALAFLTLGVMIVLETVFHIDTPLPPDGIIAKITKRFTDNDVLVVTPTPYYTPEPTATPHPMTYFDPEDEETEVVLPVDLQYYWFGDPSFCGGKMLFSAGKIVGDNVRMCALLLYDTQTRSVTELPVKPKNVHFIYPVFNDEWLVFLDANSKGGGEICAYRFGKFDVDPVIIKKVYTGQPELRLDGHYLSWIERTGTSRDKLFVCDLETEETTVIAMFTSSSYGTSAPYIKNGMLIWAAEGTQSYEDGRMSSVIRHIDFTSSVIKDYNVDGYVHDPEFNGRYVAWIDAHHSTNSTLFVGRIEGDGLADIKQIANEVVDFAIDDYYVAYSIDEAVYVYFFKSQETFRISPERELVQLLGAGEGFVIWMDVTTRERDVLKYVRIPMD
ncbi:MAG: hypothetical protein J5854_02040 [Clostridia bacterium]|nr:hypothetical protein [Clostridia bacterium]